MNTNIPWVAVIDDEEAIRRALLRLLRSAGIDAFAFASGSEFLAAVRADRPYCIVLDMHMPGMPGLDLLSHLAREDIETSVIFMTGHHTTDGYESAMLAKPLAYLLKPMNDKLLLDAIGLAHAARKHL